MRQLRRLLVTAAVLAGASSAALAASELHIALGDDPGSLDPATNASFVGRNSLQMLCDKLVDIDPKGNVVPMLATSWEWSADGKELTMKLRQGVVYHDGEPFNAESVRYNLNRFLTMDGSRRRAEISVIDKVEVIDASTVKLTLKQPSVSLLTQFTDRAGMMVSQKAVERLGTKFATAPVCAGPYRFVDYKAQQHVIMEKFPQHWRAAEYHFDRITVTPQPDATVRLLNLRAGQYDLIEQVPPSAQGDVESDKSLAMASTSLQPAYESIVFDLNARGANPDFGKKAAVRQAFSLALDRKVLTDVAFGGRYAAGNQPFPPTSPWFDEERPVPARDIDAAKAKLREAGVTNPTLDLMVSTNPEESQVAQIMQAMVADAGITLNIKPTEFITMRTATAQGDFQAYLVGSAGRVDPDLNISLAVACGQANNVGLYCNPALDALLAQARAIPDPAKRKPLYRTIMGTMLDDLPVMFLYNQKFTFAHKAGLKGFQAYPDAIIRLEGVSLGG